MKVLFLQIFHCSDCPYNVCEGGGVWVCINRNKKKYKDSKVHNVDFPLLWTEECKTTLRKGCPLKDFPVGT